MSTEVKELVRSLRKALKLSQQAVADRSGGELVRVEVNKVETGRNQATADRVRAGLAAAFGLTRDQLAEYLDGEVDLAATLGRIRANAAASAAPSGDRYPHRAQAASIALAGGVSPEAVQSVTDEVVEFSDDPPVLWWIDFIRLRESTLRRAPGEGARLPFAAEQVVKRRA